MKAGTADYPGDGTTPLCFTDMRDISLFVFHALDIDKWPEDIAMRGDVKSFKEAVEICERVQGRKWLTQINSIEKMEGEARDEPEKRFYNQVRIAFARGAGMVGDDLNRAFPRIKPIKCDEFIEKWWSGVELEEAKWEDDKCFM